MCVRVCASVISARWQQEVKHTQQPVIVSESGVFITSNFTLSADAVIAAENVLLLSLGAAQGVHFCMCESRAHRQYVFCNNIILSRFVFVFSHDHSGQTLS